MAYVSVNIDLDEFGDEEILEAAFDIIRSAKKDGHLSDIIQSIAIMLSPEPDEDECLPPPSTAAKITSMDDLRAWQKRQMEGIA